MHSSEHIILPVSPAKHANSKLESKLLLREKSGKFTACRTTTGNITLKNNSKKNLLLYMNASVLHLTDFACIKSHFVFLVSRTCKRQQINISSPWKLYLLRKYAPKCSACNQLIIPKEDGTDSFTVECLGRSYHENCYRCEVGAHCANRLI